MDYIFNRPNFLGSEVGLVLKTVGVDATTTGVKDEVIAGGLARKVLPAGTLVTVGTLTGLIFQDVDVTGATAQTQKTAPLMIAGYYIDANLPTSISGQAEALEAQNLIAIVDPDAVRPFESI